MNKEIIPNVEKGALPKGRLCAWKDCQSSYQGKLPPGWRWLAIYKEGVLDGEIDGVLCPAHVAEVGNYLRNGAKLSHNSAEERGLTV
jgi:hypothetical protein